MTMTRRWLSLPVAVAALALFGVGAVAAGFASGLLPGNSRSSQQTIGASFIDAQGNYVTVQAFSGRMSFRARGTGALTTEDTTTVYITAWNQSTGLFGSGCWTDASRPFAMKASDNSASLVFDSSATGVAPCPGDLVSAGVLSGGITPLSANESISGAIVVTANWSPAGVATNQRWTINTTCGAFGAVTEFAQVWQNSNVTANFTSFTVDGFDADGTPDTQSFAGSYTTDFGVAESVTANETVNGPSTGSCGPFGSDTP